MTQNDVMQLLIGKDIGAAPSVSKDAVVQKYSDLADGEVIVVNAHNKALSATSVLTDDLVKQYGIKVIQRSGTTLVNSDLIKQENILNYKGKTDTAGAEQVTYIGYNGTSGSIEANNSKLYVVRINLKENSLTGQGQEIILNAPYKSDASATQLEVANGVALALANVLNRQAVKPIKAELLCSAAYFSTAVFANTVTVVNGEKLVTVATNTDYNTNVDLAVGDFVRFSAPAVTGSAVTDGVYKVTELTSTTQFKVDRPIEATAGSYTAAKLSATVISASRAAAAANWGIKLTGIARTFSAGKFRYSKVSFEVGLDSASSFGETTLVYTTAMSLGFGTYEQVAELEWDLLGNQGDDYRNDFLWSAQKAEATSGKTYDVLSLNYYGDHSTQAIGGTPRRSKQLVIAFEAGFADTEAPDIVIDVLDAYTTISSGLAV